MFKLMLENVRKTAPLIHSITNYVTANDCANALIACGAAPVMADDAAEVEDITSLCGGLVINIGTLNQETIASMFLSGQKANELDLPIVLDPVGAGASALRTQTANKLLDQIQFTVVRGNSSEIKTLAEGWGTTRGVDADMADVISESNLDGAIGFAKKFAEKQSAVIVITGAIDIVAAADRAFVIRNGHPMMGNITGSGCMLSAITAAFLAANPHQALEATVAAVCAMGLCGELAFAGLKAGDGNATYRNRLIDEIYNLDGVKLARGARYEMR